MVFRSPAAAPATTAAPEPTLDSAQTWQDGLVKTSNIVDSETPRRNWSTVASNDMAGTNFAASRHTPHSTICCVLQESDGNEAHATNSTICIFVSAPGRDKCSIRLPCRDVLAQSRRSVASHLAGARRQQRTTPPTDVSVAAVA